MLRVMFFANGNTAVFRNGVQVAELQVPWILEYVKFLESQGIDPTTCDFMMPRSEGVRVFRTSDGRWNWEIS